MSLTANWTGTCLARNDSLAVLDGRLLTLNDVPVAFNACRPHSVDANFSVDMSVQRASVTPAEIMILFATIAQSESMMQQVYCVNPKEDDDCTVWGLCPFPDISGPLVTFAALITHFGLSVLIWLERDIVEAFWSHMFTVAALLTVTFISIGGGQLARSHAFAAGMLIASPPTLYIWFCGVRSLIRDVQLTRMGTIIGTLAGRLISLLSLAGWLVLAGLVGTPSDGRMFSQRRCEGQDFLFYTLGVDAGAYALWGVLGASFVLPWAMLRWHAWAVRRPTWVRLADTLSAPWRSFHPLLQFLFLAAGPGICLGFLFKRTWDHAEYVDWRQHPWRAMQPAAFLLYTWVPLFFWILVAFWRNFVSWNRGESVLGKIWKWLPRIVRFLIVVGFPTAAWLLVVLPNMVNPTGVWISYGQLLALFATAPVVVGVLRAIYAARIKPWWDERRGVVPSPDPGDEHVPLRAHAHGKSSTLESEYDADGVPPLHVHGHAHYHPDSTDPFGDYQMHERRSFQAGSDPNTPQPGGQFRYQAV